MRKKIFSLLLAILMMFAVLGEQNTAAAFYVQPPSSSEATISGFSTRRTVTVKYNCAQPILDPNVSTSQIVGYCHCYIGAYRANKKVDGKYYDALLIKCNMEPRSFTGTKGKKYYGFSQYLVLSSTLPSYCNYQYNTPTNSTIGSRSYSIGISGPRKEASLNASVELNSQFCQVTDKSSVSNRRFKVGYDYKSSLLDWISNSERNRMLFNSTWQLGTCEWTTLRSSYSLNVSVEARFGMASSKNGAGIYVSLDDYTCKATRTFTITYR